MVADGRVREAAGASSDAEDVDASAGADPVMSEADAAAVVAPDDAAGGGSVVRAELWRFVELLALCGLAVTQPLLDLYGRNPEQFVGRAGLGDATLFALAVATVPAGR